MKYTPTIGLEIHAELKTKSKMFCSSLNDPLEHHPNVNVCPICMGHPGTLPVANKQAIAMVQKVGLALNCKIVEHSKFDRKNYFYPDLPKGYQISQYDMPLCENGYLEVDGKKIRITRIHLEEDTGRLIHPEGKDYSLIDFNRAGVPLMELVTEPDITTSIEARRFAEEFQLILRYLGVSNANMEKGEMRAEPNISIKKPGAKQLGTKVEIKNLNSFRSLERATDFEIKRQEEEIENGNKIVQETRGWHDTKQITFSQREKEEAHDYRYFPEPDIPTLSFSKKEIEALRPEIPELPAQRRKRLLDEYKISPEDTEMFVRNKDLGEFFEQAVSELGPNIPHKKLEKLIQLTANYIASDLQGLLKSKDVEGEDFLITPENFAELVNFIAEGTISSAAAKEVLREMFAKGADPSHIIEEKGLTQVSDADALDKIVERVIAQNKKAVEDIKKGKTTVIKFLVGKVMAESKGQANPQVAEKLLVEKLSR
ncbi:MAG TPA: Asp-tRNA(Asn)/Glu-tRNA(Gln) amidotransferase subunit GatB [Candidatus Wildermuthbacteria bacterium]|nr:Asp-tRNA(Asn)/Glu-tRNA(Gln) amidotransferase subunit GatB [Candidatus Wildermuthbacteria bacterium]